MIAKIKNNFKFKLIFSYILVIVFSFGFISLFLVNNLEKNSLADIKSSLINQAYLVEDQLNLADLKEVNRPRLDELVKDLSAKIGCRITVIDNQGKVLVDSEKSLQEVLEMENHAGRPEIEIADAGGIGTEIRFSTTLRLNMLYVALPVIKDRQSQGVLRLALPLSSVQRQLAFVRKSIISGIVLALVLALLLGWIMAGAISRPINRITQAAHRIAQGDFSHRVLQRSKDEIGELAGALNKMSQEIEDKISQINTQNQHLKATFNSMIEGVVLVDQEGRLLSVNSSAEELFGVSKSDAEKKLLLEAVRNNELAEIAGQVLTEGRFISKEINIIFPSQRILKVNASPIFSDKATAGCLLVIHDITEIRRLERMRSDFVANVSHELKTPVTSIKGFIETLLDGAMEDKKNSREFLEIVRNHSERLNNLINDLLDLSYLESKEIRIEKSSFNLRGMFEEVILSYRSRLKNKDIKLENRIPENLQAKGDRERLEQVAVNLIDNAIKFNRENGFVYIYCEGLKDCIKIFVEDSGSGISPKDIPRIFERFYRVDKARSRQLGGTGLGLSIVKHIVELHGGTVGVENTEGLGSKFYFTLPK